jgi:hypothetical protein
MPTEIITTPSQWYKKAARAGLIAKGIVYCLCGSIALLASLKVGNNSPADAGKQDIFAFIRHQPFGKWLVLSLAIGLTCYTIWRWIQAFKDTEHKGKDKKGIAKRFTYFNSGLMYAGVAVYSYKVFLGTFTESDKSKKEVGTLLQFPFGEWLVIIIALIFIASGCYQVYRAFSGKYKKYVRSALHKDTAPWITTVGVAGYIARGIVWLIIGWLFIKAAIHSNAKEAGNSDDAFKWLYDSSYGPILLALVAAGLICYGVFMFLRAKYQVIHTG